MPKVVATPAPARQPPTLPVVSAPVTSVADPKPDHPHQTLDRVVRASAARLTGGVSFHVFLGAWGDWAYHMAQSPGRQLELVEHGQQNGWRLLAHAMQVGQEPAPPFPTPAFDHRFDHPSWQRPPDS